MLSRSLRVAPEHISKVKLALRRNRFHSQQALAINVGICRTTISSFFNGKAVDFQYFVEICDKLGLDWQAIVDVEDTNTIPDADLGKSIDALVEEVREKVKPFIKEHYSSMQVLDMTQPIGLNDIYTKVNILEEITGRRRIEFVDLVQGFDPAKFDRFGLGIITEERKPGLDAVEEYSKLLVLGKPGSGKTTFLKHLAIECNDGRFLGELVPIFITLKDFAEVENKPSLLEYITQQLSSYKSAATEVEVLLENGKILVLLDGLDEVRQEDNNRILKQIRDFSKLYYMNRFVMTCRIAAQEYVFEKFKQVEVADFDINQIQSFSQNWFKKSSLRANKFLYRLDENLRIKELATNPLMLTLLCLVFEGQGKFPTNRFELYKEAIDILLVKWDVKRNIERHEIYKNLSLGSKRDLLSYIAYKTFEQGSYLFLQVELERHIYDYISHLPDAKTSLVELSDDSKAVLKSIEAQHGLFVERANNIYSYSHRTFQEYFTARRIATSSDPNTLGMALQRLAEHITNKRWKEVFLLAVVPLRPADYLLKLMKQQVDKILVKDILLQEFITYVNDESIRIKNSLLSETSYKLAAIRAFYFDIDLSIDLSRTLSSVIDFNCSCVFACASFLTRTLNLPLSDTLSIVLMLEPDLSRYRAIEPAIAIVFARALAIDHALEIDPGLKPELKQVLQELKSQLADPNGDEEILMDWLKNKGQVWINQIRDKIVSYHKIGDAWVFNEEQKELLQQYYDANLLLMACLNNSYVTREVRQEIEDSLLLPVVEVDKRKV